MESPMKTALSLALIFFAASSSAVAQAAGQRLHVDATDASRNILHSTVTIPVTPGAITLVYPKWIPGNHRPTGPIQNLTGLHIKAGAQELDWQRDLEDMWAFHVKVPAGVKIGRASCRERAEGTDVAGDMNA